PAHGYRIRVRLPEQRGGAPPAARVLDVPPADGRGGSAPRRRVRRRVQGLHGPLGAPLAGSLLMRRSILARTALVLALAGTGGCAAASQLAALQQVEFRFDHIGSPMLAGVPLERTHSYSDFTTSELTKLAESVTSGLLPMELTVHVTGRNPESNSVTARLVAMDWVYLVDDRETVSGRLTDPV